MVIRLIKDYDSTKDSLYLAQQRDDLESIENGLNGLSNSIANHKSAVTAHTSSQVAHGGGLTVYEEIEIAKARLRNIILEADGTNIKETLDARVDKRGKVYPSLRDHLVANETDLENLDSMIQKELSFDFTTVTPVYHTNLNLADKTVLQCFVIDELTGDIYATQVASGNKDKSESFTITRMNQNGVMLDSMTLIHGGHGTTIGLERENGKVYIWSNYNVVDSNGNTVGNDLVRFPYTAGVTLNGGSGGIKRYNKFNDYYTIPVIDRENGFIAFRIRLQDDNSLVELRKLSDVKNGVNKVLGKVIIPSDLFYLQGFTIDGYDLYWYTGDTNNKTYPCEITQFSFKDGSLKKRISCNFGYGPDGKYEDGFREPESIFLYKDPKTGKKSLFAGVATGAVGKRLAKVYAYHSKENAAKFGIDLAQGYQGYKLTQNNGYSKRLPDGLKSLKEFRQPGFYYMLTTETKTLSDHPDSGNAGWWLNIAPADRAGSVIQTLTRNATARPIKILTRVVTNTGNVGDWSEISASGKLPWADLPLKNGAKNPDSNYRLQFAVQGGFLFVRGRVTIPQKDGVDFATLPASARPKKNTYKSCPVAGTTGDRKIVFRSNGNISALGLFAKSASNATYTYIDEIIKLD
ncbi:MULTISPECIES: teichoic acid biosynthesis protein [Bacillus]|uniref:phage baseplate protein n=1 Tax=Bacillus TaxID=1386 RepID=UPI00227FF1BB|nr:teichoic acid biosynthesis protein [Bacillus rugosus]MCY7782397.1 teichoic acid biosynthesis protein [Bacillus sp. S20C3]MCY8287792.1 teichoic acid biosynthesis protein [Bacillus sp. N13C7]MCY8639901.1 teichoic acid biosynthesis protein [Bacillus sp. S17B2]MCY9142931.1 teichoic acid biosynthesis protein [Bacillus sp. T9C1]MED3386526.1 teichoic acid biosynthesis protein [Bacillus subtilis]